MRKIFSLLTAILFAGSMMATDVAVTIHASSGDYYAKTHSWVSGSNSGPAYDQVVLDEVITANRIGTGNNGKYYSDWRFYTNGSDDGSFSIDAAEGYELQSVTFTYTVSNSGALYMGDTKLTSNTAVEVSGQQAVFRCKNTNTSTNGQVRLTKIAVTYQATSGGGETPEPQMKTIYCKMDQAWWKTDGAAVAAFAWTEGGAANAEFPGVRMTAVDGVADTWQIDVDLALYEKVVFARVNASGDIANWGAQTEDLVIPTDDNNLYTITTSTECWTGLDCKVEGAWSVYGEGGGDDPEPPVVSSYIFEWTKGAGAKIETDNTDLSANDMGAMTVGTSVVARLLGTNAIENNTKGYKLANNDVCLEIQGTRGFVIGDTVVITGVCGGTGARAFAIAPVTTTNAVVDTALTNTQENTSDILEYKVVVKEAQAGDKMRIFRMANKTMYIHSVKVLPYQPAPQPVEPDVYTVAGSSLLLGSNWNTEDAANDMTYNSETGFYTLVKEGLELSDGSYDYKVVKDHDWGDGEYPASGNKTLTIDESGIYTVTFTFKPNAEGEKLTADAVKTGDAEIGHVYTVVGVEALIGYNWAAGLNAPENEMTKTADDLYTLVKENITLAASSYEYQVADNHDWRNVPNSVLEISQGGIYNVTFTFVPSTGATNAVADLQEAIVVDPTAELGIGAWDNLEDWSQADMVLSGDKSYATITKTLTAGDYRFKTIINGGWRSNAYVYHRGFRAAAGISGNEDPNMKLQADVDGDYIFNWFFANDSLEIIFPAAVAPTAAPAEPTPERYQVKAVYAAKYEADCNFGEWGSGTQYAQEEYGKKFVTGSLGYFGLEFTGKNCSEMEYLHLDVWAASDIAFRVVPIHHGTEVGVTVNIEGQKWNAIDIALSEFAGVTDWSDVYQIKIDNAANLTFWLNNVYFYTTQTKTVDLVDGYYLIGTMNDWEIHNITAAHLFAVNPDNDAEYKLTYTLADGDEFKVVAVANNELGAWYPAEGDNYVVDFAHAGERDIYFRPDYQGGEGWHAGCIYVTKDENANPWETWFAVGDTWTPETESYLEWDAENGKATVRINISKYGQWRAQVKYHGPVAEEGKCYRVALKLKANYAISNVTIKYQDNAEMIYVADVALEANVEYVFDQTAAGINNGNGIMVLDFGFAHAGDIIEIYDVVIEEVECPVLEPTYYLVGSMNDWNPNGEEQYLFTVNPDNENELMLNCTLAEGDIFKVVETTSNSWFPADGGEASNYVVDAAHAGDVTIYFRPDYQGGEGWHYGCIYVDVHTGTAISNTAADAKAEKILRNGMILIVKGDKTYNIMGQIVK